MSFLLDSDICSAHLKERGGLMHRFVQHGGRLHVSVITVGEILTWALRSNASPNRLVSINHLLNGVSVLDVTEPVARRFGELRATVMDHGQTPADLDLLIGATALVHDLTLVTHNTRDFVTIPGLRLEDWIRP